MLLIALICLLAGCVTVERPIRPRPPTVSPMLTRVPAPVPRPTLGPSFDPAQDGSDRAWSRSLSAPDAPVALAAPESAVVNVVCVGYCVVGGGPSWVTSEMRVTWTHPDPASVDEYEVWRATDEPYFDPDSCTGCELATITTGLAAVVSDSPPGFNPVGGTQGANIMSRIDTYVIRARNAGGASTASNSIGVVSFSLLQGIKSFPDF